MNDAPTRRRLLAGAGAAAAGALAGCAGAIGGPGGNDTDEESNTTTAATADDAAAAVGMVYALGGLDDRSFNDAANRGVQRARLDHGIEYTNHEPRSVPGFADVQADLAASTSPDYDLVCCIGFLQAEGLSTTAPEHGDQQFMIVDSVVDAENVASYVFDEHEGSFQVGHLAGLLTSRDVNLGADATDDQADATQRVVRRVDEVADISQDVTEDAEQVSAAAEEQSASVAEIARSADELRERADSLADTVDKFDARAREDAAASGDAATDTAADDD